MTEQVRVFCLEKWFRRVNCKHACALYFPDTDQLRAMLRPLLIAIQEQCPCRERLGHKPEFDTMDNYLERIKQQGDHHGTATKINRSAGH